MLVGTLALSFVMFVGMLTLSFVVSKYNLQSSNGTSQLCTAFPIVLFLLCYVYSNCPVPYYVTFFPIVPFLFRGLYPRLHYLPAKGKHYFANLYEKSK